MRILTLLLIVGCPGSLAAQHGYIGVLGGPTAAQLADEAMHYGSVTGVFFQADRSPHIGFRTEATWVRTGMLGDAGTAGSSSVDPRFETVDFQFAELNATGRLSWQTTALAPAGGEVGLTGFAGGWLGTRVTGVIAGDDAHNLDFGHLFGVGVFYSFHRWLLEVDARSYHGEVAVTDGIGKRSGSQLVIGLGYRIH